MFVIPPVHFDCPPRPRPSYNSWPPRELAFLSTPPRLSRKPRLSLPVPSPSWWYFCLFWWPSWRPQLWFNEDYQPAGNDNQIFDLDTLPVAGSANSCCFHVAFAEFFWIPCDLLKVAAWRFFPYMSIDALSILACFICWTKLPCKGCSQRLTLACRRQHSNWYQSMINMIGASMVPPSCCK